MMLSLSLSTTTSDWLWRFVNIKVGFLVVFGVFIIFYIDNGFYVYKFLLIASRDVLQPYLVEALLFTKGFWIGDPY